MCLIVSNQNTTLNIYIENKKINLQKGNKKILILQSRKICFSRFRRLYINN